MRRQGSLVNSFRHALAGVWMVVRTQRNARIHVVAMVLAAAAGIGVGLSRLEWAILALVIGLVLAAEWFNTATEATVDLITSEQHPLAKIAKDAAAAGVLLTAGVAIVVGILILGVPLWQRLTALIH
jgi:diacylglycerol kinase